MEACGWIVVVTTAEEVPQESPKRLLIFFTSLGGSSSSGKSKMSSYIIHTDEDARPSEFATLNEWHSNMMTMLTNDDSSTRIFYGYDIVLKGFAARITEKEAAYLRRIPGILAVVADSVKMTLQTTHSPKFLDLNEGRGLWPAANFGEDVIIGVVDGGVWPESESFRDEGLRPSLGWMGGCNFELPTLCNNKLISAKTFTTGHNHFFAKENDYSQSARDTDGHGTHTASIAAGASVSGASLFGFADGTARGVANRSKLAIYKACTERVCAGSDVLAAMESAISDGVHVLSLSIGLPEGPYYDENIIALGAFAAVRRGIFVVCAAGNDGPLSYTVQNTAPWITTVGAGSIDRTFPVHIILGNGQEVVGSSLYVSSGEPFTYSYKMIYTENCLNLDRVHKYIKKKILVCTGNPFSGVAAIGLKVKKAGGKGFILLNHVEFGEGLVAQPFTLPAATVGYTDGILIRDYISMTENPTAVFIFFNTSIGSSLVAPVVVATSSRGPNPVVREVLKPDVIAPGFNILAAFPPNIPPSFSWGDKRTTNFHILSGTSMACPHVAGVAALLIATHRDWSPAAIRSAMMTTSSMTDKRFNAMTRYNDLLPATPLDYGAGHINPDLALDPGLVYDAHYRDYINFMCSLNYSPEQIKKFVRLPYPCPAKNYLESLSDLNYPSISIVFREGFKDQTIVRIVTNVGDVEGPETYQSGVQFDISTKVSITIEPTSMTFTHGLEKQAFRVNVISNGWFAGERVTGYIAWTSDKYHYVQSPILISWQ